MDPLAVKLFFALETSSIKFEEFFVKHGIFNSNIEESFEEFNQTYLSQVDKIKVNFLIDCSGRTGANTPIESYIDANMSLRAIKKQNFTNKALHEELLDGLINRDSQAMKNIFSGSIDAIHEDTLKNVLLILKSFCLMKSFPGPDYSYQEKIKIQSILRELNIISHLVKRNDFGYSNTDITENEELLVNQFRQYSKDFSLKLLNFLSMISFDNEVLKNVNNIKDYMKLFTNGFIDTYFKESRYNVREGMAIFSNRDDRLFIGLINLDDPDTNYWAIIKFIRSDGQILFIIKHFEYTVQQSGYDIILRLRTLIDNIESGQFDSLKCKSKIDLKKSSITLKKELKCLTSFTFEQTSNIREKKIQLIIREFGFEAFCDVLMNSGFI